MIEYPYEKHRKVDIWFATKSKMVSWSVDLYVKKKEIKCVNDMSKDTVITFMLRNT